MRTRIGRSVDVMSVTAAKTEGKTRRQCSSKLGGGGLLFTGARSAEIMIGGA